MPINVGEMHGALKPSTIEHTSLDTMDMIIDSNLVTVEDEKSITFNEAPQREVAYEPIQ